MSTAKKQQTSLSKKKRNETIIEFRVKARKLARSILRRWHARLDLEEVDSIVDLSLCEAVKRFDPTKGASFMTFLYYHLKGNLIRTVSAAANANVVPILDSHDPHADTGSTITALEVVEAVSGTDQRQPDELLLKKQLVDLSKNACSKLDPLERQVIERLYLKGEQLMSIAQSLGYSRCHISRVKKKALENLHDEMDRSLEGKFQDDQTTRRPLRVASSIARARKVQRRKKGIEEIISAQELSQAA